VLAVSPGSESGVTARLFRPALRFCIVNTPSKRRNPLTEPYQHIPLNKLTAWEGNVRKTGTDAGLDELAASVAAHGLLRSLVVRKEKRGRYAAVAGRRRLLALTSLAEDGRIDAAIRRGRKADCRKDVEIDSIRITEVG
jgi:hypothetical protein